MPYKIDPNKLIILYKISHNILIFTLLAWFGMLISEAILPGFVSSHIGFVELALLTFGIIVFIRFLGKKIGIDPVPTETKSIYLIIFLFLFTGIILSLALIKFNVLIIPIIIVASLLILVYFYKELISN